jgi:hypothetical protein
MGGSRNGKGDKPKAMCLNCRLSKVTGHGVYCTILPEGDLKIEQPTKYSCNAHDFFGTYS